MLLMAGPQLPVFPLVMLRCFFVLAPEQRIYTERGKLEPAFDILKCVAHIPK